MDQPRKYRAAIMDTASLSKALWELSNFVVGFAVAQALAFSYKMADEKFADLIDNPRAKMIVASAIAFSMSLYVFGFHSITEYLVSLDKQTVNLTIAYSGPTPSSQMAQDGQPLRAQIYQEVMWWRILIVVPLLLANLAALFGRQILLGRWVFGCPRPTQIASAKAGPVTIVGKVKAVGDDGARVEDRSGSITVHAEGSTGQLLAQPSMLGRRVVVIGRIDEQGRFTADKVR